MQQINNLTKRKNDNNDKITRLTEEKNALKTEIQAIEDSKKQQVD